MSSIVLDASAVLAFFQNEPGATRVKKVLSKSCVSAVNLSEVAAKLVDAGVPDERVAEALALLDFEIVPFDASLALFAGKLRRVTKVLGLSLGDRACLALGIQRGATILTTDRAWADLEKVLRIPGVRIEMLR